MTSWQPYLWKEFRQNQRMALVALGVLLGLAFIPSAISTLLSYGQWYGGDSLAMFIIGGPVLALIAGIYAMGREQGAVEMFWRSQPVETHRWLVSKFVMGLAIVWLACWVPILIEVFISPPLTSYGIASEEMTESVAYSFILLLIYSVSFVLGLCIRGIFHAAILAAGAVALIYLVPMVVAPLNWLSIEVMQKADVGALDVSSFSAFAAGMAIPSILLLWLASILLKRGIQIEVTRRTLSWSVVIMLLVLAAGIAFPMGTNLTPQQVISLPLSEESDVRGIVVDGNHVLTLVALGGQEEASQLGLVRTPFGRQTSDVDAPLWFDDLGQRQGFYNTLELAGYNASASLAYVTVARITMDANDTPDLTHLLCTVALDAEEPNRVINRVDLMPLNIGMFSSCSYQNRIYLCDRKKLLTFSLATPETPVLVANDVLNHTIGLTGPGVYGDDASAEYQIRLIPSADLDIPDRLEVTNRLKHHDWSRVGDNHILACVSNQGGIGMQLVLFEVGPVEDDIVTLRPVARRRIAVFESALGFAYGSGLYCSGSLAYRLDHDSVTVYDLGRPGRIERVGHYAAGEDFSALAVLPNNRVVIAGQKLHVLDLSGKVSAASMR